MDRSLSAKALSVFLQKFGETLKSEEKMQAYFEQKERGERPLLEYFSADIGTEIAPLLDKDHYVIGDKDAKNCILYVHGGAFTMELTPFHTLFCGRLFLRTGFSVYIPIYPLSPLHHYDEAYRMIDEIYETIKNKNVVFMGDSAGGGFVFSYAQYLRDKGEKLPSRIISISPWLDLSMTSSDYAPFEATDATLGLPGLILSGKKWANGLDTKDPRLSAMYGDNKGLPPCTLFTGTNELLYPDIVKYAEKLKTDGVEADLVVGEQMEHVYPIYLIPEALSAQKIIVQKLKECKQ